ncbi:hypothetical protein SUGI_0940390 [Cryptomeria japonica]|uniref:uncharacterized protein LOC131075977 n=1 Tax=Cryptomeria japonica TaxID=3369 RepID=UPI0024146E0B|nr:uncharacterized protein LOC131075977 [Cryptomeria japonica]GLJ44721.1 hypothetical protein SUGI_0940390 [Cryptomeria japonica]
METTVDVILEFLQAHNLSDAESALRAELQEMKALTPPLVDELPRLPPVRLQLTGNNRNGLDSCKEENSTTSFDSAIFLSLANTPQGFFPLDVQHGFCTGMKYPCGKSSTSPGISEDSSDRLSGFTTARDDDCLSESAIDYPRQHWDSDTYENDDDLGYHRQPIEDKAWFLTHEIHHPSDDEREKLQNCFSLDENLGNLDGDIKSVVEEELCLPTEENLRKERAQPDDMTILENNSLQFHKREFTNPEAMEVLTMSDPLQHLSKEKQVKFSDKVLVDCGKGQYHRSIEHYGTFFESARPESILISSDAVVSGNECIGPKIIGDMENPTRKELDMEESTHDLYFQRSSFKECLYASGIRHLVSENTTVRPSADGDTDQHGDHARHKKSSKHILEMQPPRQDLHEPLVELDLSTTNQKFKGDESPCSSSASSKETLSMGLFEHSNLSSQSINHYLCMETKGEDEMEEDLPKESAYEEFVVDEEEEVETMQDQIQNTESEEEEYEEFDLTIIHRKNRTGFEEDKDLTVVIGSIIAGRYHVSEYLGSAAFSKAIQAHDLHSGIDVCMKIIKNNKDFFDQSLDEIKILKYVNKHDPADKYHILRLYDYFYHKEHLFIVCELLRANLYEFQKFNKESEGEAYFTMARLQLIARQCLEALEFLHGLGLIHCDLKPENILVKSYSRCEIKVIDLGSSCFQTDNLCSYVQSRSYRAPEVILGLPYDQKIDIWSLGCILAELCSGNVLFQNDSLATLLARMIGILGPIDPEMLAQGRDTHMYFTKNHVLYERIEETEQLGYILPKKSSLRHRLPTGDVGFLEFVGYLLQINPLHRPSAREALNHPWISYPYDPISY